MRRIFEKVGLNLDREEAADLPPLGAVVRRHDPQAIPFGRIRAEFDRRHA